MKFTVIISKREAFKSTFLAHGFWRLGAAKTIYVAEGDGEVAFELWERDDYKDLLTRKGIEYLVNVANGKAISGFAAMGSTNTGRQLLPPLLL